jgi:hypothetical protein
MPGKCGTLLRVRFTEWLGIIVEAQEVPPILVLFFWIFELAERVVVVRLSFAPWRSEPLSMILDGVTCYVLAGNDVVLGSLEIVQANKHEIEVRRLAGFNLLIQHPGLAATLNCFHLNSNTLCRVQVRSKNVYSSCVSQRERCDVASSCQFSCNEVLARDA